MKYVPLALEMIDLTRAVPVDVWAPGGMLLLRRGQAILTDAHRESLRVRGACLTQGDADAWQNSHERMLGSMIRRGVPLAVIAKALLPDEISPADFSVSRENSGGWLDLQENLLGLFYQGSAALHPLPRLAGIERRALELLNSKPDECLFVLFQALADLTLGYSATHALLSAVVCELTTDKLAMPLHTRRVLFRSALTMNIGMARDQVILASQSVAPTEHQRQVIKDHPPKSHEILRALGVWDQDQLDIVHWHHDTDESNGLARNITSRRILRMADGFAAKMAPRKTRLAMSPLGAVKALLSGTEENTGKFGSAMATAVGFYPPGTYVQLANGEKSVVIARGAKANQPHVASIINPAGMPVSLYSYRDTSDARFAVHSHVNADQVKVMVSREKVARMRADHLGRA